MPLRTVRKKKAKIYIKKALEALSLEELEYIRFRIDQHAGRSHTVRSMFELMTDGRKQPKSKYVHL